MKSLLQFIQLAKKQKNKAEKLRANGHEIKLHRTIKDLPSRYGTGTHGVFRVVRKRVKGD